MSWPKSKLLFVVLGTLAGSCTGTGHQLPQVSEAEKAAARQEISAAPALKRSTRTSTENERLARQALKRLQAAVRPVCAHVKRDQCWFKLAYYHKSIENAAIVKNQIILYDGLAQYLENEDEFAAIIAHEMGHHLAFHYEEDAENRAIGAVIAAVIFGGLAAASGAYQYNPYGLQRDMNSWSRLGAAVGDISFSKEQEAEADYIAAYLMTRAGYNPEAATQVWVKLTKISGRTKTALLDTHPAGPDRLAAWYKSVEQVRYSADLMPNAVGSAEESRLQVARSFDEPQTARTDLQVAAQTTKNSQVAASDIAAAGNALTSQSFDMPSVPSVFMATADWQGIGGHLEGRLKMVEIGSNRGDLELAFGEGRQNSAFDCAGTWRQKVNTSGLRVGTWSMTCNNGRSADGGYRLSDDHDGRVGLTDSLGNFVELKLATL